MDALRKVLPALMAPDKEGDIHVDDVLDGVVSGEGGDSHVDKIEKLLAIPDFLPIFTGKGLHFIKSPSLNLRMLFKPPKI